MKTYGSIFQAETEGTICPVKESYYIRGALPIYYRGKEGGGRHGLLEAACNDLPKLEDHREEWVSGRERVLAMMRVEFEVCFWKRMAFLEKRIFLTISV